MNARPPALLRMLDRVFVPDPAGRMSDDQMTTHEIAKASVSMGGYLAELGEDKAKDLAVLDFGCGWGGETLWLAGKVREAVGVDVERSAIDQANAALRDSGITNCSFAWSCDGRLPFPDGTFDAVLSTDTFEHVMNLDLAFSEIARVLKPGGALLSKWGPLFYSPHGYHLYWACKVPWAHVLFGLKAIAAMRAMRGGSASAPKTWQDLGLNGQRFRDYVKAVEQTGLEVVRFEPIAVKRLNAVAKVPWLGDLFIFGVDCHLRRRA